MYKIGEKREFRVIKVSKDEHKLGLSTKLEETTKEEKRVAKPAPTKTASEPAIKPKSQLQIALEEAAARNNDNDDKE